MAEMNSIRETSMSLTTVKWRLRSNGLFGQIAARKPLLRSVNKQKRLKWAKEYEKWTVKQWKKVWWTDELKFQLFGQNRRVFVRRKNGERMTDGCVMVESRCWFGGVLVEKVQETWCRLKE